MRLLPWRDKDAKAMVVMYKQLHHDVPRGYLVGDTLIHAIQLIHSYQMLPKTYGLIYAIWYHHHIIGYIQAIRLSKQCWEIGYYLNQDKQNRGYMTRAVAILIDILQTIPDIQTIQARVLKDNIASIKVLEHNHFIRTQTWDDSYCYQKNIKK